MVEYFWPTMAFASWVVLGAVLILLSRSLLPMANSLGALHKVDALIDDRIMRVVERLRQKEQKMAVTVPRTPEAANNAAADALRDIFGGPPLEPMDEQPDSALEIVN